MGVRSSASKYLLKSLRGLCLCIEFLKYYMNEQQQLQVQEPLQVQHQLQVQQHQGKQELDKPKVEIERVKRETMEIEHIPPGYTLKAIKRGRKVYYYWYKYWRERGKLKWKYIGKQLKCE